MSKEVTKKSKQEVGSASDMDAWGGDNTTQNDIIIPKLLPLQAMSEAVMNGEGKFGEFRDTLNGDILGDTENPVEFVPFYLEKVWVKFKNKEFDGIEAVTPETESLPLEEKVGNDLIVRDRCILAYVLLPKELEENDTAMPYILSFKRTSLRAGKKLWTTMYVKNRMANLIPAAKTFTLHGVRTQNDQGTYIVQDVKLGRDATEKEKGAAFEWLKIVKQGAAKVDHSDEQAEAATKKAPKPQYSEGDF